MKTLQIELIHEGAKAPSLGTSHSAGWDLHTTESRLTLLPNETKLVGTGLKMAIPEGYYGEIHPRSGLGSKGLVLGNLTGIIDSDYRGEVKLCLWNRSNDAITVNVGKPVAQLIIKKQVEINLMAVSELSDTERGTGGFGHTDRSIL